MGKQSRLLAALLAGTLAACAHPGGPGSAQVASVGHPAPLWNEPSVGGSKLSLAALRGKAVYLNLFASWCTPCGDEAPSINALSHSLASRGLQVIGVDILENERKAAEFRNEHHLQYPVIVDAGTVRDQYRVNGLPVHVFIDRAGIVRQIVVGQMSPEQMRSDAEHIL